MLDFDSALNSLAHKRPVFHSEADFQYALAWELRLENPNIDIRLEYPPPWLEGRIHLDLWVMEGDTATAVELKYMTQRIDISLGRERFALKGHSAQDSGRYDFVKDIERLERVVAAGRRVIGYAVMLTNDHLYWSLPRRNDTLDADFRIHEGRSLSGSLAWDPKAAQGTQENREDSIDLSGSYGLLWKNYSFVDSPRNEEFRYALVQVSGQQ